MSLTILLQDAGYTLVFLTMISVLVAAHELGHYVFARWFGMGVEEFAIGFGRRPLFVWLRRRYLVPVGAQSEVHTSRAAPSAAVRIASGLEGVAPPSPVERVDTPSGPALRETTEFTVRPLPLGGFVRIKGMIPEEDGSETKIPGGFYSKAPWKRFLVLLAGPLFSVLAGVFALVPVQLVNGKEVPLNTPVLAMVDPTMAAARAGLKAGDRIVAIDGARIANFYQIIQSMQASKGRPMRVEFERNGKDSTVSLIATRDVGPTPVRGPDLEFIPDQMAIQYKMGALCESKTVPISFPAAIVGAVGVPVDAVEHLANLFRKPSEFSNSIAGPAAIASATAEATRSGLWAVIELAGLLSISVGILNLLPAPPLDGGQMAMAVAEMLRGGRRLSIRAQAIAGGIGLTLVAALIFSALAVDIKRFITPDKSISPAPPAKTAPAR